MVDIDSHVDGATRMATMSTRQSSAPADPGRGTLDWRPAVIITDTHGVVTYWNSAAERLYGWSATEAMGQAIIDLLVDPADLVIANDIVASAAAGSGWEGRFPVRRKDGTTFVINAVDEALVDAEGKTIGIIGISRSWVEAVAAPDGDRVLAAEQLVRNARSRAEAATRRLEHLQRIAAALSNLLSPDEVAEVIMTEVAPEMGGASQALWLLDETGQALRLVKVAESPRAAQFAEMPLGGNLPGARVVSTGQAVFVNSREERDRLFPTLSGLSNSASFAVLPLAAGGAVAGILATAFDDDHTFEPEERRFLTAVADLAAQAMERARLHATEMRAAERLAFLAEASATLSSSLDYQETVAHVVRLIVPRVADVATVHLVGEDGVLRRVALAHRDPEREADLLAYQAEQGPLIRNPALAAAAVRGETTRQVGRAIGGQAVVDEVHARLVASLDITSNITAPLVSRGETIGVLNFLRTGDSPPYQADDQALAEELARRAAVAFDNARMHQRRTEVARLLQASLLPPELPRCPMPTWPPPTIPPARESRRAATSTTCSPCQGAAGPS